MRKYDSYKDSGIEWIGEIPEHWEVKRLKHLISLNDEVLSEKTDDNEIINYIEIGDIKNGEVNSTELLFKDSPSRARRIVKNGDVIVSTVRTYLQAITQVDEKRSGYVVSTGFAVLRPRKISSGYLGYFTVSSFFINSTIAYSVGVSYPAINAVTILTFPLHLPPLPEQTAIAAYLDRKTAEIDELIADKKRLLELYEEEKTAVINQAVTKGINPDVPMKDSGIEWLGEIPEHWEVKRIGHCGKIVRGGSPRPTGDPRYFMGNFIHWITVKEVTNAKGKFVTDTEEFLTEAGSKLSRIIEPETLLLSNSGATLGVPKISKIKGCINDGSVAFPELKFFLERDFLYYFFVSHTNIYREQMKGNGQPNLNTEIVKSTFIPLPNSIEEQREIVQYIENNWAQVEAKKAKTKKLIELLTEYRTALISEVVTGKVKVTADF